jgi:hypothetical protein
MYFTGGLHTRVHFLDIPISVACGIDIYKKVRTLSGINSAKQPITHMQTLRSPRLVLAMKLWINVQY